MTVVLHTRAKSLHVHLTIVTLEMETCVRGFHVYKAILEAAVGEELECGRVRGNRVDRYAMAVVKDETVVRHVATAPEDFTDVQLKTVDRLGLAALS